jgi:hypothetical protein
MQQIRLKQAKERVDSEKKEIERLQSEIAGFLQSRDSEDLQSSIQLASDRIQSIRKFQQVDERLQKLAVHRDELEGETLDLESDDGFSWERVIMLAIPFFIGAFMLISGLNNFFGWYNNANMPATARALQLQSTDTQNTGVLMTVLGLIILVATYLWWKSMEKGMEGELTDVEAKNNNSSASSPSQTLRSSSNCVKPNMNSVSVNRIFPSITTKQPPKIATTPLANRPPMQPKDSSRLELHGRKPFTNWAWLNRSPRKVSGSSPKATNRS